MTGGYLLPVKRNLYVERCTSNLSRTARYARARESLPADYRLATHRGVYE